MKNLLNELLKTCQERLKVLEGWYDAEAISYQNGKLEGRKIELKSIIDQLELINVPIRYMISVTGDYNDADYVTTTRDVPPHKLEQLISIFKVIVQQRDISEAKKTLIDTCKLTCAEYEIAEDYFPNTPENSELHSIISITVISYIDKQKYEKNTTI